VGGWRGGWMRGKICLKGTSKLKKKFAERKDG
jgi:hypothetical protein